MAISGSGNVAIYAAYKCLELGAKVITLSDSGGYHIVEEGMTKEMIDAIDDIKVVKKGRLHEYKNDKGEPAANDDFFLCSSTSCATTHHCPPLSVWFGPASKAPSKKLFDIEL